jgi:hypothetical protein
MPDPPKTAPDTELDDSFEGTAAAPGAQDGVPAFAKDAVPWQNVHEVAAPRQVEGNAQVVADVDPANDTQINVRAPEAYDPATRAHEATHVAQFNRTDGVVPNQESGEKLATTTNDYKYGDLDQLRSQGKTMANMTQEQQASMVHDYLQQSRALEAKGRAGTASQQDLAQYSKLQQTYHPWIRDLAPQPQGNAINTTPEPPGLPSADTPGLGVMAPDKLMGGGYTPIHKDSDFMAVPKPKGLIERGNLPIWNRPTVQNADGSHSTEYSRSSADKNGHEVLYPTVVNGRFLTPNGMKPPEGSEQENVMFDRARQHYEQTGEHLGKFDTRQNSDKYAEALHNRGTQRDPSTGYVPILKHGAGAPLSKADAARYLQAANGNKQVARAFAHHDQHTF